MSTLRILTGVVLLLITPLTSLAQTWDGGALDDNFTSASNWNPNGVPANNGTANLTFDGAVRTSPDVNVNFNVNSVAFAPTAANFVIQRTNNSILTVQGGGITNNDAGLQTFEVPVNFGANSTINASAGPLTLRGDIGLGASAVTVGGSFDVNFSNFLAITGTGSLTKNNNNDFNISSDGSEQNYDLTMNAGTVNFSGSGPIFGNNASLQLNGGTMTVASILTLTVREGATLIKTAGATLSLGNGMSIESGGDATLQGTYAVVPSGLYRVTGTGSTLTANEFLVSNDARLEVLSGGTTTIQSRFMVGSITNGTAVVDGGTLNASTVTFTPAIGASGGTGAMTVRNSGVADYTSRTLSIGSAGTGTLLVERGGDMVVGQFLVGIGGSGSGTVTVTGVGSTLRTNATSNSEIGMASGATGAVNLNEGGELNLTGGLNIRRTGVLNINGGILTMAPTRRITNEGALNFNSGKIVLGESLGIGGANSLLGVNLALTTGSEVDVSVGSVTVASPGALVIDGGVLRAGQLVNQGGTIDFRRGTLLITDGIFTIDSDGPLGRTVTLGAGQTLDVSENAIVQGGAVLQLGDGASFSAATLTSSGNIVLDGAAALLRGGIVNNSGVLRGEGIVHATVNNSSFGEIRGEDGKVLTHVGANGPNAGRIVLQGGTIHLGQPLTNTAAGLISGRGTLIAAGGLTNQGKMQFSGGPTDIYGNVTFTGGTGGGEMINSGGANVVTFYGNVVHNGDEIRTSPTNTTVFFGDVTGAGPFTGTGAVRFEGTFAPGNSPAAVTFEGDLNLGGDARLSMEIGGTIEGSQRDHVDVAGSLLVDGTLEVLLLNQFQPAVGDRFDLFDYLALDGRFDEIKLPLLPAGHYWDATELYSSGTLLVSAIPEPAAVLIWITACVCVGAFVCCRRR
jgi:hypothetical protein